MKYRTLTVLAVVVTMFSIGHHIDHIIRGNHVGWPLIPEVTPFTYSLGFYPVIAVGFFLWARGRIGAGFWAILSVIGILFVTLVHFGPFAAEPPQDILTPYSSPVFGWLALAWLGGFILMLATTSVYAIRLWSQQRGKSSLE